MTDRRFTEECSYGGTDRQFIEERSYGGTDRQFSEEHSYGETDRRFTEESSSRGTDRRFTEECSYGGTDRRFTEERSYGGTDRRFTEERSSVETDTRFSEERSSGGTDSAHCGAVHNFLSPKLWADCPMESIIPYDVDGLHKYSIVCERKGMMKVSTDGRPWKPWMNSKRQFFSGVRRLAHCKGSPLCDSESCQINGNNNRVQFQHIEGILCCAICGLPAKPVLCHARKIWEYNSGSVKVMYHGNHTCVAKNKAKRQSIQKLLLKHPGLTQAAVVYNEMDALLLENDINWSAVEQVADDFSNRQQVANVKKEIDTNDHGHSFDAVCLFKRKCDEYDKFLVYRVNNGEMNNGDPTYVFKSSKRMAQVAVSMDRENGTCKEYVHVDAKHDRVKGMKSLTVWMYHKQHRRVYCLAIMEVTEENGQNITLLWETFNDMLREVKSDPTYIFNPVGMLFKNCYHTYYK